MQQGFSLLSQYIILPSFEKTPRITQIPRIFIFSICAIRGVFYILKNSLDSIHTHDLIIRMIDTKQKILDTAEELFAEFGYSATSLRHIISKAQVKPAAVHYHFDSKQDLLDQVVMRKAGPMNERWISSARFS
jgi:hypothetical protein